MSKRNSITYGKRRCSSIRATNSFQQTEDKFAACLKSDDVVFPPTKKQHLTSTSSISMAEPTEEQIVSVTEFAYCDRETAIRYLKAKNNNSDQAVAAIFDQEDISSNKVELPTAWDDSVWAAGKDGVESEQTLRPLGTSTAPTRGPSPVGSFRHPGSKEQEDADVAAALAASAHDISYGQQETGVMRADGTTIPAYGPHPQMRYQNPSDWALVKVTPATEIVPDVDPVDRRYVPNEPRLLKNPASGDYLPAFLTICHSIPAARELLLLPDYERFDYGSDTEWWKGHHITLPQIVHTEDGSPTNPLLARYDDFMAEIQRLMAFLGSSERAYATTIALEQSRALNMHGKTAMSSQRTNVDTFIKELSAATQSLRGNDESVENFFGVKAGSDGGDMDTKILEVFQFDVDTADGTKDLLQILDDVLWNIEEDDELEDRYLEQLPQVWVMRLKQAGSASTLQVTAPASIYMDKYLKENVDEVRPFRERIASEKRRISKITAVEKKLKTWKTNGGISIDSQKLLQHAKSQFAAQEDAVAPLINSISETTIDSDKVAARLDDIIESIDQKLKILSEERVKTEKVLSELSTSPSPEFAAAHNDHKYTLVGISTKPNITYILQPKEEEEMLIDNREEEDDTPAGMQWWRTEYVTNATKASINRNKIAAYEALPAIQHEHHTAFLIYASDAALEKRTIPLNDGLKKFIQIDNEFFQQELRDAPAPSYALNFSMDDADARQSIERRESFDSVRAQGSEHEYDARDPAQHASYGLGYGGGDFDPPVAEIPPPDETYHSEMSDAHKVEL